MNPLFIIIVILLLLWGFGGLPQLTGWGAGFGGQEIHLIWLIVIIIVLAMVLGRP